VLTVQVVRVCCACACARGAGGLSVTRTGYDGFDIGVRVYFKADPVTRHYRPPLKHTFALDLKRAMAVDRVAVPPADQKLVDGDGPKCGPHLRREAAYKKCAPCLEAAHRFHLAHLTITEKAERHNFFAKRVKRAVVPAPAVQVEGRPPGGLPHGNGSGSGSVSGASVVRLPYCTQCFSPHMGWQAYRTACPHCGKPTQSTEFEYMCFDCLDERNLCACCGRQFADDTDAADANTTSDSRSGCQCQCQRRRQCQIFLILFFKNGRSWYQVGSPTFRVPEFGSRRIGEAIPAVPGFGAIFPAKLSPGRDLSSGRLTCQA
jgi:hypothetical protein